MAQSRSDTVKVLGSKNPLTTLKKWLKQAQKKLPTQRTLGYVSFHYRC